LTSLDLAIRESNRVISGRAVQSKASDWQAALPELASTAEVEPAAKRRNRRNAAKPQRNRKSRQKDNGQENGIPPHISVPYFSVSRSSGKFPRSLRRITTIAVPHCAVHFT
jgi:hypothetical protein